MATNQPDLPASPAAEELIELLLGFVPAAIALFDRDMRYLACNTRWIDDLGLSQRQIIGRSHYEIFPEMPEEWRELHRQAMAGKSFSRIREPFPRMNGRVDWISWSISPWHDAKGNVGGVLIITEMVTSQIEHELRYRILGEELSLYVASEDKTAMVMLDDVGRISLWNSGAESLFGWNEEEIKGKSFERMFGPSDLARGLPQRQLEAARDHGLFRDSGWRVRKDGSHFLADVTISRITGDQLFPGGYGKIIRDLTKVDGHARSLEASSVLLRSILDTVPDAVIVIDEQGIVLSFSKAAEALFGYAREEVIGRNVSMLMPSPYREQHDTYLAHYRATGKQHVIGSKRRLRGARKDGTVFPLNLHVGEAFGGGQRMFAGFLHDLTEAETAEARLQELQRELSQIARINEMGTLATTMAHELNQPLMALCNMLQTSSDLLAKSSDKQTLALVREALEESGEMALRAGSILKRLRTFVSRGELERTLEQPGPIVRETCELAASDARMRNIALKVTMPDDLEAILVDRVQIQQVLLNLIRNAMDAIGRDGEVRIGVGPRGTMMEFMIWDSGPGVPVDRVPRLFETFETTKADGMGMGLSICRTIVEAHGGKIWYEHGSTPGAAFFVTMPLGRQEQADVH